MKGGYFWRGPPFSVVSWALGSGLLGTRTWIVFQIYTLFLISFGSIWSSKWRSKEVKLIAKLIKRPLVFQFVSRHCFWTEFCSMLAPIWPLFWSSRLDETHIFYGSTCSKFIQVIYQNRSRNQAKSLSKSLSKHNKTVTSFCLCFKYVFQAFWLLKR